ncbi:hypothetical protein ASE25_19355 [Terrabacter sp. Root85]|uniref:hypothetical protein n=1 Tax=Terrabacter sp. Root85 TaxID=1736603 RepID=UPI0006F1D709|nr:hypothetical protein [Terrabacter sp. Root85]KRC85209.1 hypothetical protein ASE25_19355 [Terrabacter sp. Root85]
MTETDWGRRLQRTPLHAPGATHAGDRSTSRKVYAFDGDEHPQTLDLPGPRVLASRWLAPTLRDAGNRLRRQGGALLLQTGEETPLRVAPDALAGVLLARLRALPTPTPSDSETYAALWALGARVRERDALDYLRAVVGHAKTAATKYEPPKVARGRREPLPEDERKRRSRASLKHREGETARAWLRFWLADDEEPPAVIGTRALYDTYAACPVLGEWHEYAEDDPEDWLDGGGDEEAGLDCLPRVGGATGFYRVADDVIGPRRRASGGRGSVYVTTDARRRALGLDTLADALARHAAEAAPEMPLRRAA